MMRILTTAETKNSLLQLNQHRTNSNTDPEAPDLAPAAAPEPVPAAESVITQVTTREPQRPPPPRPRPFETSAEREGDEARGSWRSRFRSLFCCLAPALSGSYTRSHEAEAVVIRPPQPATPPRWGGGPVLGPQAERHRGLKTLVLDLDETLVHSSFKPIANPDYVIPVEIEGRLVDVYVLKRPWMDHFLATLGPKFEVVVFTASLAKYAAPLLDLLDSGRVVAWRLFREACHPHEGNYVKDLACLGRDLAHVIIVDNSPHSYVFQPDNALPIGTFIDDPEDQELLDIMPLLLAVEKVDDVRRHLGHHIANLHASQQAAARID